jgi:hypothetical protein
MREGRLSAGVENDRAQNRVFASSRLLPPEHVYRARNLHSCSFRMLKWSSSGHMSVMTSIDLVSHESNAKCLPQENKNAFRSLRTFVADAT